MKCRYCKSENVVKNGFQSTGCRKYYCKNCLRYFQESCGIRSIARILCISSSTVIKRIKKIVNKLERPYPILKGKVYEVDELFTYLKYKDNRICIAYSYEPKTGQVFDISVGRRTKINLRKVIETLVLSEAKTIYTDELDMYKN